jgi:hypothetical protein
VLLKFFGTCSAQAQKSGNAVGKPGKNRYEFRIGWRGGNESRNIISLFDTININAQYHVFSLTGRELFVSTRFRKIFKSDCDEDDKNVYWSLVPDTWFNSTKTIDEVYYCCLVIGTSDKIVFDSLHVESVSKTQQDLCVKALVTIDSLPTDSTSITNIHYYSAGTQGNSHRIIIEQDYGFVALCQVMRNECQILFVKNHFSDDRVDVFCGQADLDGDGMSDVFALHAGDRDGPFILVKENGGWILKSQARPGPC